MVADDRDIFLCYFLILENMYYILYIFFTLVKE